MPIIDIVIVIAILISVVIGLVSLYAHQREDTVIGALWAVGMAAGLLFIDLTPGYYNLTSYLFGDILLISKSDLWLVIVLDVVVVSLSIYFYNTLLGVCFDHDPFNSKLSSRICQRISDCTL